MPTVYLIRHGRTHANAQGVLTGQSAVRLDERGVRQAVSAGRRLRRVPLEAIVTSPLRRTRQTARLIQEQRDHSVAVKPDVAFVEVDYGEWSGRSLAELAELDLWTTVQEHPSAVRFPDGESIAGAQHRAVTAIRDWNSSGLDTYAVVSHGDIIKAIIADAYGMHLDHFQRIVIDPGSISVIHYAPKRPSVLVTNSTHGTLRFHAQHSRPTVGGGGGS